MLRKCNKMNITYLGPVCVCACVCVCETHTHTVCLTRQEKDNNKTQVFTKIHSHLGAVQGSFQTRGQRILNQSDEAYARSCRAQIWGFRQKNCHKQWKVSVWSERWGSHVVRVSLRNVVWRLPNVDNSKCVGFVKHFNIFWTRVSIYLLVVWVISKCWKFLGLFLSYWNISTELPVTVFNQCWGSSELLLSLLNSVCWRELPSYRRSVSHPFLFLSFSLSLFLSCSRWVKQTMWLNKRKREREKERKMWSVWANKTKTERENEKTTMENENKWDSEKERNRER